MRWPVLTVTIKYEHDVVAARRRARQIAGLLGFEAQDQSRIATAVSEIARNAFNYADGGRVEFYVEGLVEAIMRATGRRNKETQAGISVKSRVKGNVKR